MQNSQWKIMSFGVLALFGLGYYFNKLSKQKEQYKQKLKQFNEVFEQSSRYSFKSVNELMTAKDGSPIKQKTLCFINVKPQYNPSTFKLYERQRSIYFKGPRYGNQQILQHQMGGDFTFLHSGQTIKCKLDDFNLSGYLLKQEKKDVHLFKGINQIQPIVCSVTTGLFPLVNVSIYGKLFFDNNTLKWTIQPFFLTAYFELKTKVQQFYQSKSSIATGIKFAIFVGGLMLGYFTIIKPLVSLFKKRKVPQKQKIFGNDLQYFKNKEYLLVKGQNKLNCQKCKQKSVQIIYECGHLSLCTNCHQKNEDKQCPICKKPSKKFMKIFMA